MDRRIAERRAADTADRLSQALHLYETERRAHDRRKALAERRESARICHWIDRFDAARQERAAKADDFHYWQDDKSMDVAEFAKENL